MKWIDKRVLVTGGAGFLGGAIVQDLSQQGAEVVVVDNMSVGTCSDVDYRVEEIIIGDVNNETLSDVSDPKDFDFIFHFAAPCTVLMFDKDPMSLYMNALTSAYSIRKFAVDNNIPKVIYASSATYYGKTASSWFQKGHHSELKYQEQMPPCPANIYGATKTAEENLDSVLTGPRYLGLRIFPSYGAREYLKGDVASICYKIAKSVIEDEPMEIWGEGYQMRDYIYIDDFTYVVRTLVERGATGYINIGSGVETSHNELISIAKWYVGHPEWEATYISNPYADTYLMSLKSDISKMREYIGRYSFTPIQHGMRDMIKEMIEGGAEGDYIVSCDEVDNDI